MNYKKIRSKEIDYCNICGKKAKLTWDHVPPKSCNNKYSIKVNSWFDGLPAENKYEKKYQNGIKYRSLCDKCNNNILGAKYDIVLDEFSSQIMKIVSSSIELPPIFKISVKINRLTRAICGHFLATKNYYDRDCSIDNELRKYVLDAKRLPPEEMSLLYWIYPYSSIVIMRDICVKSYKTQNSLKGTLSIVNSFPMAYIISSSKEDKCGLYDLFKYCSEDIDDKVDIVIDLKSCFYLNTNKLRNYQWPCNVSDEEDGVAFILGNDDNMKSSIVAKHSSNSINMIRKNIR